MKSIDRHVLIYKCLGCSKEEKFTSANTAETIRNAGLISMDCIKCGSEMILQNGKEGEIGGKEKEDV